MSTTAAKPVHDLIYLDSEHHAEVQELIRAKFPAAEFADASDYVHEGRFEVTIPDASPGEYHRHLIAHNLGGNSLGTRLWYGALTPKQREAITARGETDARAISGEG